jgi:hypothetical protein
MYPADRPINLTIPMPASKTTNAIYQHASHDQKVIEYVTASPSGIVPTIGQIADSFRFGRPNSHLCCLDGTVKSKGAIDVIDIIINRFGNASH